MVLREELTCYLNQLLNVKNISDYCVNGLQVSGKEEIKTIVTGVTACKALLEKAALLKADAILVHHGYFWKNEEPSLTGMKYERLRILFEHQMNLFAYHLPLDVHLQYGNNVQLAKQLDLEIKGQSNVEELPLVFYGNLTIPMTTDILSKHIENVLMRKPFYIQGNEKPCIQSVAWCTGAGQKFIELAFQLGVDAYLTGEVSESTTHAARELGINFFACGHHATERYGILALGEHLANQFGIKHQFIDIENPV